MCDCLPSSTLAFSIIKLQKAALITHRSFTQYSPCNYHTPTTRFSSLKVRANRDPAVLGAEENQFYAELGFKQKGEEEELLLESTIDKNSSSAGSDKGTDLVGLVEKERGGEMAGRLKEEDLVRVEKLRQENGRAKGLRRGRQVIRRSNLIAKQVISVQSALSLGFVSQIWVDTTAWVVLVVEARPNLLSGESERFLLEDVSQVGDVVLVEDENVIDNELKMVGLESLVGYRVVTPGRQDIGKVRGYSFNINSGAVESLELDSFGISIIPSSLVSTYALLVEDVLEVLSDTVVVHETAASRLQKLTKGFWGSQNVGTKMDELGQYADYGSSVGSNRGRSTKRSVGSRKFRPKIRESEDDWELPMDYL